MLKEKPRAGAVTPAIFMFVIFKLRKDFDALIDAFKRQRIRLDSLEVFANGNIDRQKSEIRNLSTKLNGSEITNRITTDLLVGRIEDLRKQIDVLGRQNKWLTQEVLSLTSKQKPAKKTSTTKGKNKGQDGAKKGQRIDSK